MATITVSYDGVELILSDNGHTNASRSEQIHWHPGSGVKSVTNVTAKSTSPISTANFWSNPPHQNGVNFKGTINDTVVGDWDYDISCNVGTNSNPVIKTKDPKIQVLSR
ncbi:MAG: hypothetical protein ABR597_11660 [Bacteroidales bacterium]